MIFEKNSEETMAVLNMVSKKESRQPAMELVHEVRNPLTAVKGFLQLIKPYLKESGKERYADVALLELNRATQLISDYLHGTKRLPDTNHNITVNKVINDLAILYENEAASKNIHFITTLSNQEAVIRIPENQLKQVLINMINNAMEAIDEYEPVTRKIELSTQINLDTVAIKITDTCGGLSGEMMKNLFTPYCSTKKTGTGIGLVICKKIAEEYEGTIDVESIPDTQTIFTICFPIETLHNQLSL